MRVTARGKLAFVKLEDKISGEKEADTAVSLFTSTATDVNHFRVLSPVRHPPSLLLIYSKVTQPTSKQAVYFEANRLLMSFCLLSVHFKYWHACCSQIIPYIAHFLFDLNTRSEPILNLV